MKACLCMVSMAFLVGAAAAQQTAAPAQPAAQTAPATQTNPPATGATPAQVKTQTYKGTLVDTACTSQGATPATANSSTPAKGAANRSASDQGCPVSATTSQFGLRMNDGRVLRFDMVGNERAQQAIKNKKKWNTAATAGKTIHAKVSGTISGDTLTVVTID